MDNSNQKPDDTKLTDEDIVELAKFFDILAKADWEDKQAKKLLPPNNPMRRD